MIADFAIANLAGALGHTDDVINATTVSLRVFAVDGEAPDILVDMNNDGAPDLLVGGQTSKNVVWYQNPKTGACQPVPRHREINEYLAKHVLKKLSE